MLNKEMKFLQININTILTGLVVALVTGLIVQGKKFTEDMAEIKATVKARTEQMDRLSLQVDELQKQITDLRIKISEIKNQNKP